VDDLGLYRALHDPNAEAERLARGLRELGELPMPERMAMLGAVARALASPSDEVRGAALFALRGVTGPMGVEALVTALDDEAAAVRSAAVEALRVTAATHPARWTHAIFHPRDDVRLAAAQGAAPSANDLAIYLLTDPYCHAVVLERLGVAGPSIGSFALLVELVMRGVLPRTLARTALLNAAWLDAAAELERYGGRAQAHVDAVLKATDLNEVDRALAAAPMDPLDALLDLMIEREGEAPTPSGTAFERVRAALGRWPFPVRQRALASLVALGRARGELPAPARLTLAIFVPTFIDYAWVPAEQRRAGVLALHDHPTEVPPTEDAAVEALLARPFFRDASGKLDLRLVAAALLRLNNHPIKRALHWLGAETIVNAFLDDPPSALPLLALEDASKRGTTFLLATIETLGALSSAQLLAMRIRSARERTFVERLPATLVRDAAIELLAMTDPPWPTLTTKDARAIALAMAMGVIEAGSAPALDAWLQRPDPASSAFGRELFAAIAESSSTEQLTASVVMIEARRLRALLRAIAAASSFPYGNEVALARELTLHADEEVRAWALARVSTNAKPPPPRAPTTALFDLTEDVARAIATASDADLASALAPCLEMPSRGLTDALARRARPVAANAVVCVALLGAHDPIADVDAWFARYGANMTLVDRFALRRWAHHDGLPLHGNAWLWRFDRHALAAAPVLIAEPGIAEQLTRSHELITAPLRHNLWALAANLVAIWRWRDKATLTAVVNEALCDACVHALTTDVGPSAADILITLVDAGTFTRLVEVTRPRVMERLPDIDDATRERLGSWVSARGVAKARPKAKAVASALDPTERLRAMTDLKAISTLCEGADVALVEAAALRLLELGHAGHEALADVILRAPPAIARLAHAATLVPSGAARSRLMSAAREAARGEVAFALSIAFAGTDRTFVVSALAAARAPAPSWFTPGDWAALRALGQTERALALALATSPHPHAYLPAIEQLLKFPGDEAESRAAVRDFLAQGTERSAALRRSAARWLAKRGDHFGFLIMLDERLDPTAHHLADRPLRGASAMDVEDAITSVLLDGQREHLALELLAERGENDDVRTACLERILVACRNATVRQSTLATLPARAGRATRVQTIAETFAWGMRLGRELTGRLFRVHMLAGDALGYTRLNESVIHVSVLPILTRERDARAIVEGLILHELGHHVHHRGDAAEEAWKQGQREQIGGLLNLVADEHLERNLRARDAEFGDRLKQLGAWAFQHKARSLDARELVASLGARAFEVLSRTRLRVAKKDSDVVVESGSLLAQMERAGQSFARFFRALRMGLGNRWNDPLVDQGLALFKGGFRRKTMPELLTIARELVRIFGGEVRALERIAGHESTGDGVEDTRDQVTQEEIDAEVERVLDPKKRGAGGGAGPAGKPWVNVSEEERFPLMTTVVPVAHEPAAHAVIAREIARESAEMRRFFERVGLAYVPVRGRLAGRRFDTTRAQAVVTRGDPRMLVARTLAVRTDLFLGLVVDCSGSMQTRGNIDKAKRFATLLVEAARGLSGIDVRVLGFTDTTIYDAGDASRCAAHALEAGGGNNDAGALFHAAGLARASRRRARLLVMISDGLPTECSTTALRMLVTKLEKQAIACAQVAVQPLAERCFSSYVVLDHDTIAESVRRFGEVVARLVQRAVSP
jgi:hypothetical protein